jgi:hypothetical protein
MVRHAVDARWKPRRVAPSPIARSAPYHASVLFHVGEHRRRSGLTRIRDDAGGGRMKAQHRYRT